RGAVFPAARRRPAPFRMGTRPQTGGWYAMTAPPAIDLSGVARRCAAHELPAGKSEGAAPPGARRLLMIARDFPPVSTSAALRALAFARHLREHGWESSVVCTRFDALGMPDPPLLPQGPPHCHVRRAFGFDTKAVLSINDRYLRLLATPDRDASWFPDGVLSCLRVCRTERPDVLLSTSPPVTAHCIGWVVKRITKLPWIMELRDPWNIDVPSGPLSRRLDRWLERHILLPAHRILGTTEGLAADLEQRFGADLGRKTAVVHNGYDEDAFARLRPAAAARVPFRVVHPGQCTPPARDPLPFLRAVRRSLDRGALPADTEVLFVGAGHSLERQLAEELQRLRLASHVRITGWIAHEHALHALFEAAVLLIVQNRDAHRYSIPAKAYQYLRSPACILALTPAESATAALLSGFPGVWQ